MYFADWLHGFNSRIQGLSSPTETVSRRRRMSVTRFQRAETLEVRVMLSGESAAPSITQLGAPAAYVEGGAPVAVTSTGQITDPADAYSGSSLTAQNQFHSSSSTDVLSIIAGQNVTVVSGVVSYKGTAIGTKTGGTGGGPTGRDIQFQCDFGGRAGGA